LQKKLDDKNRFYFYPLLGNPYSLGISHSYSLTRSWKIVGRHSEEYPLSMQHSTFSLSHTQKLQEHFLYWLTWIKLQTITIFRNNSTIRRFLYQNMAKYVTTCIYFPPILWAFSRGSQNIE
jgi:hypothetical protein